MSWRLRLSVETILRLTPYKRIEQVIADLAEHVLATPIATTVPLVTYKTADRDRRDGRGRA